MIPYPHGIEKHFLRHIPLLLTLYSTLFCLLCFYHFEWNTNISTLTTIIIITNSFTATDTPPPSSFHMQHDFHPHQQQHLKIHPFSHRHRSYNQQRHNHIHNHYGLIPYPPVVPLKVKVVSCGLVKEVKITGDADVWVEIRGVSNRVIALISPKAKRSRLALLYFQTTFSSYIYPPLHIFSLSGHN